MSASRSDPRSLPKYIAAILGTAVVILMLAVVWLDPQPLVRLENFVIDLQFKLRDRRVPGEDIIIITVDEKSLAEVGRWPWARDRQAALVEAISAGQPKVIGLDIVYSEPEIIQWPSQLGLVLEKLKRLNVPSALLQQVESTLESTQDLVLAGSIRRANNIVLPYAFLSEVKKPGSGETVSSMLKRNEFLLVKQARSLNELQPYRVVDAVLPLKQFADSCMGMGHVYSLPDLDGVTRYDYPAVRYAAGYYPSFAIEMARIYLDVPRERMSLAVGDGIQLGNVFIPTDQHARMLINYVGAEGSFRTLSATDVLHHRVPADTFAGKLILIGTSAVGTYSHHVTPFSANFPSVEVHATIVENILRGDFVKIPMWRRPLEVIIIILFGVLLTYQLPRTSALRGTALAAALLLSWTLLAQIVFRYSGTLIPVLIPVATILTTFIVLTVLNFLTKDKQAREIRAMFASYVSPKIVAELVKCPAKMQLGGERKELTVLFADLVGFSGFTEKQAAEAVVEQLNEYLTAMTEAVFRWDGTLDKFMGDGMMVFWGAPLDQPNHAELAIKCALDMRRRLNTLHEKWRSEGKPVLENGIGINTGVALVGNIGAESKKMDYTVIGDQVNVASRIEGLSRIYGDPIIISDSTADRIKRLIDAEDTDGNSGRVGHVKLARLGSVAVKGKNNSVIAYSLKSLERNEPSIIEDL